MRKRRSLSIVKAGDWPAWYDEPRPSRSRFTPGAAMSRFRVGSCSRLSLMLFFLVVLNSMWFMAVGAAPVTSVSKDSRSSAGSRTSLSRCPAIFNPIPMVANAKVVTSSDKTVQNGGSNATEPSTCRYFLTERFGTLTTPGFPSAFPLPFICSWIINATGFEADSFVTLYLTQMYLTRGVKAVQYSFRNETTAIGRKELDELHTLRPRPYSVYRIKARYLEVQVNLDELVNANLRVERRFMDVYGFNITYEIQPNTSRIRSDTCNVANCTFNGHCYANHNYSQFQCSCLPDFSGKYCQYGPECNPEKGINVCKNGGVCGYRSGLTVVRCSCPPNYNGSLCEFRREFIPSKECLSRFRLNCSHHCVVTDKGGAACRCPLDQALRSDNVTCYPLVPLRILGNVELDRPITFSDKRLVDGVTTELKKMTGELTAYLFVVGSVDLFESDSNRLQFILWNSENYNISRTNWIQQQIPSVAAVKSRSFSALLNRSATGIGSSLPGSKKRMPRDIINPFTITYIPQQWNNSYSSFVNQINTKTWKVQGEAIAIRNLSIVQVPALIIEWVKLDVKGQVREGYPFTVACNANGSGRKDLKMGWFKDGHRVDNSFALARNVSIFIHEKQDLRGFFTFYLEVKQASLADRGEFECRATDWGQTVRKSVFLDVITPPILDLMPINPVVLPGTAVNLTCRDENHLARRTTTKYVWLKNGRPIESSCDEIIEDLTPVGSLLKITAIQHSTNYSCRGENGTKLANKTTHIFVVRPDRACPQEKNRGVEWLMTAVDVTNYQFCPAGYVGVTRRRCLSVKQPIDNSEIAATAVREFWKWDEPDFSDCSDREVTELYRQLKLITLGYAVTDLASIINKFADFIQRKLKEFADHENLKSAGSEQTIQFLYLPGEGNALLEIAMNLEAFLWKRTEVLPQSFWDSTAIQYLYALDALLSMPKDFYRLDGGIPILRFIQNHLTLLGISPKGGNPLGAIESHLLRNSEIDTDSNKKELKYKERLKLLPSQTGFKNLTQLAPAQFFLNKPNGSNVTMDFYSTVEQLRRKGGEYICALLLLQPTNHSRGWDMNSCSIERLSDPSAFRCLCFHQGTVVLLYAERDSMQHTDATFDLWKVIVFVASTSSLIVAIGVVVLSIKWYRHRCVWAWFQIQLGVALVPPSSVYFLPTESIISDPFWTIVLTVATYQFVTTVWAMIMYLKMNTIHRPDEEEVSDKFNQNNVRLVGLSIGIPLSLSGVQSLIEEFSTGSPFVSWFSQLSSISGIFFCLIYCTLLIAILSLYVMSTRVRDVSSEKFNAFTQEVPNVTEISSSCNQRCLLLAILSLLLTGTMLSHLRWMSLSAHCIAAFLHLLEVLLVLALMVTFSGTNYICALFCLWRRNKLPERETVNELLNATAMVESPQKRNLLPQEQLPVNDETLKTINKTKRISQPSVGDTLFPAPNRSKRCNRAGPASSPLLQRAGLGPEVLRAFGVEPQSSHQLVGKTVGCPQAENTSVNGPGDAMGSGRNRVNSITTCDGMQRDDMDSGFGPSGGGGSQKLNGLDRFSDAWKFLSRIRWKLPLRGFPSSGSTSGGGSFRSRQSTISSATTAEFGGEQSSSVTTEETEVQIREGEDAESLMAPYRLRRSRTRWTDDYGRENELDSKEVSNLTIKCKPYRGRCFIRCSPEKIGSNPLWNHHCQDVISDRQASWFPTQNDSCERCWHNPETPFCDICLTDNSHPVQSRPGTMFVHAVVENPPKLPNKDVCEYLEMDAAGSLAVDQQRVKRLQVYYNTTVKPATQTKNDGDSNDINKEKLMSCASLTNSSFISPSILRQKKILSGRIVKKYRISLRNVVHSTQQRRPNEIDYPAEFISLRDQTL